MTTRVPFRAPATPPITPVKTRSEMVNHARAGSSSSSAVPFNRYPESPTGHVRTLPPVGRERDHGFPLTSQSTSRHMKNRWGLPRAVKSPRRVGGLVVVLGLVILLVRMDYMVKPGDRVFETLRTMLPRWSSKAPVEEGDGLCQFWSTMDAYRRDLDRLHTMFPPNASTASPPRAPPHSHHRHLYSSTGHLLVSDRADAPHPIPVLLGLGEKRWEELLSRQSRTLEEAVQEYNRRYGRQPPKGFDVWWEYAMLHNLVLPDEYDRINLDLAPFFALPRDEMRRRMEMVEEMKETFTILITNGEVEVQILDPGGLEWGGTMPRAKSTAE